MMLPARTCDRAAHDALPDPGPVQSFGVSL